MDNFIDTSSSAAFSLTMYDGLELYDTSAKEQIRIRHIVDKTGLGKTWIQARRPKNQRNGVWETIRLSTEDDRQMIRTTINQTFKRPPNI